MVWTISIDAKGPEQITLYKLLERHRKGKPHQVCIIVRKEKNMFVDYFQSCHVVT